MYPNHSSSLQNGFSMNNNTNKIPRNLAHQPAIVIGNLSSNINEETLFDIFHGFGIIEDIQIKRSSMFNDATYAYIRFQRFDFAQAAMNSMQGRMFQDLPLRIIWAHEFEQNPPVPPPRPTIIPPPQDLRQGSDLNRFSSPLAMELNSYNRNPPASFLPPTPIPASNASLSTFVPGPLAVTPPILPMRSQLDLSLKSYNTVRVEPPSTIRPQLPKKKDKKLETAQVHFSYVTNRPATVTMEELRNVFSHFGAIIDVAVKKSNVNKITFTQTGYGFIHFPLTSEGVTAAVETAKHMEGMVLDSVKYSCSLSHGLKSIVERAAARPELSTPQDFQVMDDQLNRSNEF